MAAESEGRDPRMPCCRRGLGAEGPGRSCAGRLGGVGARDHSPHGGPWLWWVRGEQVRGAGREGRGAGTSPMCQEPTPSPGLCHPRTPVCGLPGLLHTWSPVEQGSSASGTLADPGPPLSLCSHSAARASGSLSAGPATIRGLGRPPALPLRCRPQAEGTAEPPRGSETLPVRTASPAQADHPGGRAVSWCVPQMGPSGDGMARVMSQAIPGDLSEPCTTSQQHEKEGEGETDVVSCKHADFSM